MNQQKVSHSSRAVFGVQKTSFYPDFEAKIPIFAAPDIRVGGVLFLRPKPKQICN
jgi:hypothetical protein